MSANAEKESGYLDSIKLFAALLVMAAGVGGFYYFSGESVLYRVLGLLFFLGLSLLLFFTTTVGRQLWQFARASRMEARKVVWPSRNETVQTTMIVLFVVFLVGLFLWLLDWLLSWVFQWLTTVGGG